MGIEKFFEGVITNKNDIDPQKAREATERIRMQKQEEIEKRNDFMIEYDLAEMHINGQLTDDDIDELMSFVNKKTNLTEEEKKILKQEVIAKAHKMAQEKLKRAA